LSVKDADPAISRGRADLELDGVRGRHRHRSSRGHSGDLVRDRPPGHRERREIDDSTRRVLVGDRLRKITTGKNGQLVVTGECQLDTHPLSSTTGRD
jgi:hypothetical protein